MSPNALTSGFTPFIARAGCVDFYSLAGSNHSFVADYVLRAVLEVHLPSILVTSSFDLRIRG